MCGVAGKFPPQYIGGVFSGQAVGGILASVTNVVLLATGVHPTLGAFFCFAFAVVFLAFSLGLYIWLTRSNMHLDLMAPPLGATKIPTWPSNNFFP